MKIIAALMVLLYLAPPSGLLAYGIASGGVDGLWSGLVVLLRGVVLAIAAVAIGIGISEKVRFLQHDGVIFYARFYVFYLVLFFLLALLLGLEIQFPDQHRAGRYSY